MAMGRRPVLRIVPYWQTIWSDGRRLSPWFFEVLQQHGAELSKRPIVKELDRDHKQLINLAKGVWAVNTILAQAAQSYRKQTGEELMVPDAPSVAGRVAGGAVLSGAGVGIASLGFVPHQWEILRVAEEFVGSVAVLAGLPSVTSALADRKLIARVVEKGKTDAENMMSKDGIAGMPTSLSQFDSATPGQLKTTQSLAYVAMRSMSEVFLGYATEHPDKVDDLGAKAAVGDDPVAASLSVLIGAERVAREAGKSFEI